MPLVAVFSKRGTLWTFDARIFLGRMQAAIRFSNFLVTARNARKFILDGVKDLGQQSKSFIC